MGLSAIRWCVLALVALAAQPSLPVAAEGFRQGAWPFRALTRPAVPATARNDWAKNPVDHFVLERLADSGLSPSCEAERLVLLRRVTFDLTGLPPTIAEQDAFLADASPDAYENVVDRLLASPHYGERWAQHWLDVVRYAETDGFKSDRLKPNAWRYRDYVIRAFNDDLPYDRFVRQQLAGDELEPENPEALVATGYLRLGPDEDNAANLHQRRQELLDEITDTAGLTFLGLTIGCAQCHDHKFDPILQTDYFRLQAFFAALTERDGATAASPAELASYAEQLARWEAATADVRRQLEELLAPERAKVASSALEKYEATIQECYLTPEESRTPEQRRIARMVERRMTFQFEDAMPDRLNKEQRARYDDLQRQLGEYASLRPRDLPQAMAVADLGPVAPQTFLLDGGSLSRPREALQPGFPEFLTDEPPEPIATPPASTGRRSQLAHWLTRPDHPLTARVIVNRVWQHHFGEGIVATPNDFGFQGGSPSHPALLDWLATELVENGWRLKHVHRLMVTSATYRQASRVVAADPGTASAMQADPENRWLWHARRRRLEGEAVRDAMLAVSRDLNDRMYGESARPELPNGVSARYAWKPDAAPEDRNRRSIYVFAKRNMRFPMFEAFDQPDLHQSCARRPTTVTAPQSLLMLNSKFTRETAEHWASRLTESNTADGALVQQAYREAFGRLPAAEELCQATTFLMEQREFLAQESELAADARREAVSDFCQALFNSNEFVTVD